MAEQGINPYNPGSPVRPNHFAGRETEIKAIRRWLANSRNGDPARLFIKGGWGVGKTSLLRKFQSEFIEHGVVVREDVPDGMPYVAQAHAFYSAVVEELTEETGVDLDLGFEFSYGDRRAVRKLLTKLIVKLWNEKEMIVIIVLDNLERATPEFLSNVKDVFQRIVEEAPYFMLVFAGTTLPGAGEQASDPIARAFETVQVGPMNREESLEAIFKPLKANPGFKIDEDAAELIQGRAAGHPYFIKQICSQVYVSANGKGTVGRSWLESHWSEVEDSLERNRFGEQLSRLAASESHTLLHGSLRGLEFPRSSISGLKSSALDTALNRLKKSGLLLSVSRGTYRFYHPLFHTFIRAKAMEAGTVATPEQCGGIQELIAQGESHHLEFKETLEADNKTGEKHPKLVDMVLKTIVAFHNSDGGTLLIGVADDGTVKGIGPDLNLMGKKKMQSKDGFELKISSLVKDKLTPKRTHRVTIRWDSHGGMDVCIVEVKRLADVSYLGDILYVRDGNQTVKVHPGPEMEQYLRDRQRD